MGSGKGKTKRVNVINKPRDLLKELSYKYNHTILLNSRDWDNYCFKKGIADEKIINYYFPSKKITVKELNDQHISYVTTEIFHDIMENNLFSFQDLTSYSNHIIPKEDTITNYKDYKIEIIRDYTGDNIKVAISLINGENNRIAYSHYFDYDSDINKKGKELNQYFIKTKLVDNNNDLHNKYHPIELISMIIKQI